MRTTGGSTHFEIDRGPNWLFVKLYPADLPAVEEELADDLWAIASRHFVYRLVVEMDLFQSLSKKAIAQLAELQARLESHGGALRVCGLSSKCAKRLEKYQQEHVLRSHSSRRSAVLGAEHAAHHLPAPHYVLGSNELELGSSELELGSNELTTSPAVTKDIAGEVVAAR